MKIRKGFTFWEMLVILVIVAVLAAILWPVLPQNRASHDSRTSQCQSHLKQISLALLQYQVDADEKFPPTSKVHGGWVQLIQPYAKNWQIFRCPTTQNMTEATTDYALNSRVAGVALEKFEFLTNTFLVFDGQSAAPPHFAVSQLPKSWVNERFPAKRHRRGRNFGAHYAFADGHVKWLRPEQVMVNKPNSSVYTFLVR